MANNYSTQDLVKGVLSHCGERTDGTSPYRQAALKYINNVYKNVISGANEFAPEIGDAWSWAKRTSSFLQPVLYDNGSADCTFESATVTLDPAPTISLKNYNIQFNGSEQRTWYYVTEHEANSTTLTLDSGYVDATATDVSFKAVPLTHDLGAGILRLIEPFRIYLDRVLEYQEKAEDQGRIYGMSTLEFWKKWPLRYVQQQVPSKFTTIFRSESEWIVRFNKYVKDHPLKVDYDWIAIPDELVDSSDSIPIFPFEYRDILVTGASYYLMLDKSQPGKADQFFKLTQAKIQAMHLAEEKYEKLVSVRYGMLTPRHDDTARPWYLVNPTL